MGNGALDPPLRNTQHFIVHSCYYLSTYVSLECQSFSMLYLENIRKIFLDVSASSYTWENLLIISLNSSPNHSVGYWPHNTRIMPKVLHAFSQNNPTKVNFYHTNAILMIYIFWNTKKPIWKSVPFCTILCQLSCLVSILLELIRKLIRLKGFPSDLRKFCFAAISEAKHSIIAFSSRSTLLLLATELKQKHNFVAHENIVLFFQQTFLSWFFLFFFSFLGSMFTSSKLHRIDSAIPAKKTLLLVLRKSRIGGV